MTIFFEKFGGHGFFGPPWLHLCYKVYPFESFTLSPLEKMLGSWYSEYVHIHVFMGIHETANNNQEDLKH